MRRSAGTIAAGICVALLAWGARAAESSPRAAPDEIDERLMTGADLTLPELLRSGGGFSYVMIALSVAVVAAGIYCGIECGKRRVLPDGVRAKVMDRLAAGDRAGALAALEGPPSLFARGVGAVLSTSGPPTAAPPPEEARAVLRASGERDAAILRGRLAMLVRLAALAALAALLGTLVGMHQAFAAAATEVYRPLHAYAAVFKGLVVSVFGVGLALVATACYFVLSATLERALAEAGFAFEEVARALRHGDTPADGPGPGPAAASKAEASS